MRNALAVLAVTIAVVIASVITATPGRAYPGCYYSYYGCYLGPGWYDGRYWGGGPWWGWGGYGPNMPMPGCPLPYETGACG